MYLTGADKVDHDARPIQCPKDSSQESMRDGFPVRMYVQDDNIIFDGDGGG